MALQNVRSSTADKRPVATSLSPGQIAINYEAGSPGLFFRGSDDSLVKIGPIHVGSTAPNGTPAGSSGNSDGEGWLDTSGASPVFKIWDGSAWSSTIASIPLSSLDIDGGTDIGGALTDGDLIIVDDGGAGTNRKATVTRITDYAFGKISGDIAIAGNGTASISSGVIVDADISASAAIADTKLATIGTAGKVSNSATTATSLNTASAIVARDASGNFAAGTITAALSGNASTATKLETARSINGVSFDGTADITITAAVVAGSIVDADINASAAISDSKLATISTTGKVSGTAITSGNISTSGSFATTSTVAVGQSSAAANTDFDLAGTYAQTVVAVAALDIDCSTGNYFTKTISGDSTFTVSNVPASRAYSFTLELTHTSGTVTWFSGVEWPGGSAPTLTTGKTHLFVFVTDDGGTRWRGAALANYTN